MGVASTLAMPRCHGWLPYSDEDFLRLLMAAVDALPAGTPGSFVDVGSGVGTKCLLAKGIGLDAEGVEHDPELVRVARSYGVKTELADVYDFDYSRFGIVYVNSPFVADEDEAPFERWLQGEVGSGAALIQVNDCGPPPVGWATVVDERDAWRGVWVKR